MFSLITSSNQFKGSFGHTYSTLNSTNLRFCNYSQQPEIAQVYLLFENFTYAPLDHQRPHLSSLLTWSCRHRLLPLPHPPTLPFFQSYTANIFNEPVKVGSEWENIYITLYHVGHRFLQVLSHIRGFEPQLRRYFFSEIWY